MVEVSSDSLIKRCISFHYALVRFVQSGLCLLTGKIREFRITSSGSGRRHRLHFVNPLLILWLHSNARNQIFHWNFPRRDQMDGHK